MATCTYLSIITLNIIRLSSITVLKLFHKIKDKGKFPKSFYKANSTLIPEPNKDTFLPTKKNYRPISFTIIDPAVYICTMRYY